MRSLSHNFREWLKKLGGDGHGRVARICLTTGLKQPFVSKILAGEQSGDIRIDLLGEIARNMELEPHELLFHIETGQVPPPRFTRPTRKRPTSR